MEDPLGWMELVNTYTEYIWLFIISLYYIQIHTDIYRFVKIKIPLNSWRISHPRGDLRPSNGARSWFWLPMIKSTVNNQTKINNNTLKREKDPLWSIAANAFRRLSSRRGVNTALSRSRAARGCLETVTANRCWQKRSQAWPRVTGWWILRGITPRTI